MAVAKRTTLAERLANAMAAAGCAGAVVGVWAGGEREVAAAGPADWETGAPLTPTTRMALASVTKPIVATAAVRAWQARAIPLDAPLLELLPDLAAHWRASPRMSLRHLLSHTSGLRPGITPSELSGYAFSSDGLGRAARRTVQSGQLWPVGAAWQYCNPGYALAGHALGVVAGGGVEAGLRRYVLEPAGMSDTGFGGAHASGHAGPSPVRGPYPRALRPAGGLVGTVTDLLRFAEFAIDDATLSLTGSAVAASTNGGRYGLGWNLAHRGRVRWHHGDWGGFHSLLLVVPVRRVAVAVLSNDDGGVALREALAWSEAGVPRPRLAPYLHTGRSWLRLTSTRALAPLRRRAR